MNSVGATTPAKTRLIRKYPNRRLYDTQASRYVTLEEILRLVKNCTSFQVQDSRTKKDITRAILFQVIAEREENGDPIFSTELLTTIIRLYGHPTQRTIIRYLERLTHSFP